MTAIQGIIVAPFTGAWIETLCNLFSGRAGTGRALHGRVD